MDSTGEGRSTANTNDPPAKAHRLAPTHAGGGDEHRGGDERIVGGAVEQLGQLGCGPCGVVGLDRLRRPRGGDADADAVRWPFDLNTSSFAPR